MGCLVDYENTMRRARQRRDDARNVAWKLYADLPRGLATRAEYDAALAASKLEDQRFERADRKAMATYQAALALSAPVDVGSIDDNFPLSMRDYVATRRHSWRRRP